MVKLKPLSGCHENELVIELTTVLSVFGHKYCTWYSVLGSRYTNCKWWNSNVWHTGIHAYIHMVTNGKKAGYFFFFFRLIRSKEIKWTEPSAPEMFHENCDIRYSQITIGLDSVTDFKERISIHLIRAGYIFLLKWLLAIDIIFQSVHSPWFLSLSIELWL